MNSVVLVSEVLSGAAQTALDLIENQQRPGAVAQLPRGLQKFRTERADPTLSLNRFQANGADAAIKLSHEIVYIVEADEPDARHQRRERMPILFLSCCRERAESRSEEHTSELQH